MKKLCSITQNYYPADVRVKKQCELLYKNGYSPYVICIKNKDEKKYEKINGVEVYRLNLQKKRGSILRYFYEYTMFFILAFIKLNILDLTKHFNIIQINNLPDFLIFTTFFQKLKGVKIVLDMHEITPEFFMSKYKISRNNFIIKILTKIEKVSLNFADAVITINEPIKNLFNERSIPKKNISIIMNTVDDTIIPVIRKQVDEHFNLVYHGTISEIYGLDIAIRALENYYKINKNFKFYIFGSGPQEEYLKSLIRKIKLENHIFLLGNYSFEEMMRELSRMTIGLLPIRKDVFLDLSFSNKLSEYVYLKIPVIMSNLNTTQYYFSDDEITYFISEDINDLQVKILFAYENSSVVKERAEKAFQKFQSYKWSVMSERYLNLLRSIELK